MNLQKIAFALALAALGAASIRSQNLDAVPLDDLTMDPGARYLHGLSDQSPTYSTTTSDQAAGGTADARRLESDDPAGPEFL